MIPNFWENSRSAEKEIFLRWYVLTDKEKAEQGFPVTQQGFKKVVGVSAETLVEWGRRARAEGIYPPSKKAGFKKKVPAVVLPPEMEDSINPPILDSRQMWWNDERNEAINQAIFESAKQGNPNSQKLAKQLRGELVERKEVVFVLSADDYFRIRREAQSRIREITGERNGDRGMQSEPEVFLPEDGISAKQEHNQDGKMASVGLSA